MGLLRRIRAILDKAPPEEQGKQLADIEADDVVVHPMVSGRMHTHGGLLAKAGDQEPRAVHVCDHDRPSRRREDVPLVHWSVKERFDRVPDYRPAALRGVKFRLLGKDGEESRVIDGIAGLREYRLQGSATAPPGS